MAEVIKEALPDGKDVAQQAKNSFIKDAAKAMPVVEGVKGAEKVADNTPDTIDSQKIIKENSGKTGSGVQITDSVNKTEVKKIAEETETKVKDAKKEIDSEGDGKTNVRNRLPINNGYWEGDVGNSLWYSDIDAVNRITGGEGIPFVNGRPDFSKWAKGTQIFKPGELNGTNKDFVAVYKKLMADSNGKIKSQNAARKWLKNKGLTPHHHSETTIIFVPTDLHGNIPHIGSASDMRGNVR